MPKPKIDEATENKDFREALDKPAAVPLDTDDNDDPNADASGDSDDERPDENLAVPDDEAQ
jgi:hypothetical protein